MIGSAGSLVGRRIALRPYSAGFTDEELALIHRWGGDKTLAGLSGGMALDMGFAEFRALFLQQANRKNGDQEQLFVLLDEHGGLIGRAGLFAINQRDGTAELGILIGDPASWGRGYGRDAVSRLVRFGFEELRLCRIVLHTYPDNARARRAFAAAGFRDAGQRRRFCWTRGTYTEIEMEITASEHELRNA